MSDQRHPKKEGQEVIDAAAEFGWTAKRKKGASYFHMYCGCGQHHTWLHISPSNPNYFKERIAFMKKKCNSADR